MPKPPKRADAKPAAETTEAGGTKPISYKPSKPIEAAMAKYRSKSEFPPTKSAIIERALREFFEQRDIEVGE